MGASLHFRGPAKYRLLSMAEFGESVTEVWVRRMAKGPRRPGWNWFMELATELLKRRMSTVREMTDVQEARRYLDSLEIRLPELDEVDITQVTNERFRGSWFTPRKAEGGATVLYFHGGGYSFYPKAYASFIALVALAAKSRTFALDYSLAPEQRFPVQVREALDAYRWLLENSGDGHSIVVAGDSAGGNLALALLQTLRDLRLPMPMLAIALSPPTDFEMDRAVAVRKADGDWIEMGMLERWADWFCDPEKRRDPLVSPLQADLHGLPPIYLQAGGAELLYDSIRAFADRARREGAEVVLESWADMNHDFQMFGRYVPQSAEALRRVGEMIETRKREVQSAKAVFR